MNKPEMQKRFRLRLEELKAESLVLNEQSLESVLGDFLTTEQCEAIVISDSLFDPEFLRAIEQYAIVHNLSDSHYSDQQVRDVCSQVTIGITKVDALIADTGTVVQCSRHRADRLCSLLPEIHIAIATDCPIYENMEGFLKSCDSQFSYFFISGPSRTADIEKTLVLGAHGPKRLVVVMSN